MGVELTGYHGTSKINAETIKEANAFKKSIKNNEWLGHGVYFYELVEKADWWAKSRFKNNSCVLKTVIDVEDEHYCNLDIPEKEDELVEFINELENNCEFNYVFHGNDDKRRCDLFNLYSKYKEIHVLGATLESTNPKGKDVLLSFKYIRTEKQYCVYNKKCIKDTEILR